jgi:hypothetical protein
MYSRGTSSHAMVLQREGTLGALGVGTEEPVLLPADGHGHPAKGQADVGDDRAVLDPRPPPTGRADKLTHLLLDRDLTGRAGGHRTEHRRL